MGRRFPVAVESLREQAYFLPVYISLAASHPSLVNCSHSAQATLTHRGNITCQSFSMV